MRIHRIEVPIGPLVPGEPRPADARPAGFPTGYVNAWLLPDPPVTLVDCGPDLAAAVDALRKGFLAAEIPLRSLEQIVVTHGHPDHGGAAGRLAEATGAAVLAHEADLLALRDPAAARAVRWRGIEAALKEAGASAEDTAQVRARFDTFAPLMGAAPRAKAFSGSVLEAGGVLFDVLHVPGHTPGHVALHAPRESALFTGDALLGKIVANASAIDAKDRDALGRHLASLERLLGLPPVTVHPGHGDTFGDHGSVIGRDLAHHARRSDKVLALLARGPRTARGVVDGLFLGRVDAHFAISEVLGHLGLLAREKLAEPAPGPAGAVVWSATPEGARRALADADADAS